jgi:peptide/nickel transport system permease protein
VLRSAQRDDHEDALTAMLNFLLKRLALAIPTLLAVSFLVFLAARLAPASPIDIIAGDKATPET